jgi:AcrR family transcriptional regulator
MRAAVPLNVPAGRKAQSTYRALVRWTRAVLAETGGFSAELVAERAGMSPATFYAYFPSKDEALAAALDEVLTELVDRSMRELDIERLLDDGLRAVMQRAAMACLDVFTASAVVLRLALARLPESRTIRHVYREHQRQAMEEIQRFIRLGAAAGRLSADDHESVSLALIVGFQGLNNPLLLNRERDDPAVSRTIDMLVHLLAPDGGGRRG